MRFLVIATLMGAAACGPGGGHTSPPPTGYTGEFRLERYHTYLPAQPVSPFLFAQATFQSPEDVYLSAGSRIDLKGPGVTIPMVRIDVFGKILYQRDPAGDPLPGSDYVAGADYDAVSTGSRENGSVPSFDIPGAIRTPAAFELFAPNIRPGQIDIDGTTPLDLSWNAGDGDYVLVIFAVASNNVGHYLSYKCADDGGCPIPQIDLQNLLPKGVGSLTVERVIEGSVPLPDGGTGKTFGGDAVSVRLVRN